MADTLSAAVARQRFEGIKEGYEADGPDPSVPGASKEPARYAVVTESLRGHGYFVNYATRVNIEKVAAANISEGWQPVCYYDLAVLAGEEPILMDGDRVRFNDEERIVSHHDYESAEGEPYPVVYLVDGNDWEGPLDPDNEDMELIERAHPDDRNPVRYSVAKIVTVVAFNTRPEEA